MKLKRIFSTVLALGIMTNGISVFAADGDYFKLGTPYDLTTGEAATEIIEGHKIAVPVDITSSTGKMDSYQVVAEYDSDVLSAGFTYEACVGNEAGNLVSLAGDAGNLSQDPNTGLYGAVRGTYTMGFGKTYVGTQTTNTNYHVDSGENGSYVLTGWFHTASTASTDDPECYLLFTVNKTVDEDELNFEAIKLVQAECELSDNPNSKPNVTNVAGESAKVNACDGAFKVVVDSSALPYWVQGVNAKINGTSYALDALVQDGDTTVYGFPVRVTSAADEASVDVEIEATVTDDETGLENSRTVSWGTVNVDMSGTANTYASSNASISE